MIRKQFFTVNKHTYLIGCVFVTQEFDAAGGHRLVVDGVASGPRGYQGISKLKTPDGAYYGTSEFYGLLLPRVFQVVEGHVVKALEGEG